MNALEQLRERLVGGITLRVVANDLHDDHADRKYVLGQVLQHQARVSEAGRTVGWIHLPTRVGDVEWIGEDTVSWPIPAKRGARPGPARITYELPPVTT